MGNVESSTCLPAGSSRQPLFNRNPPVGSGPTCSRGAGCELSSAAKTMHAMARRGLSADFIQVPPLYSRGAEDLVVRATRRAHLFFRDLLQLRLDHGAHGLEFQR